MRRWATGLGRRQLALQHRLGAFGDWGLGIGDGTFFESRAVTQRTLILRWDGAAEPPP